MDDNMNKQVSVEFQYLPKLNYAVWHNGVKIINVFTVKNITDHNISNLVIDITPALPFAKPFTEVIESLPLNQTLNINDYDLELDSTFILQLTERIETSISVSVRCADEVPFTQEFPISILTFNEWAGVDECPDLLSSFVTPNSPALQPIISRASEILKEWTGDGSLNGYQTKDPDRVKKISGAVFESLKELHIAYNSPIAHFEHAGQRIRMTEDVMSSRMATCIDSPILYASCLEAIGLYALIIVIPNHAFAGVWMVSDNAPNAVSDDASYLKKRIGLNDLILVETTLIRDSENVSFDDACLAGLKNLDDDTQPITIVDVSRCRISGIRPLPVRNLEGGKWIVDSKSLQETEHVKPVQINSQDIQGITDPKTHSKREVWERKLLDLSLRNALLNFRLTQKAMILLSPDVAQLEDAIWDGNDFQIQPCLKELEMPDAENRLTGIHLSTSVSEYLTQQMQNNRLCSTLEEHDNMDALKALYRASKVSIEENGANSLYMAIGMLLWTEPKVAKNHYAPLLLVPMEIVRRGAGYVVRSRDEETLLNVTLVEMLRQNFQITVGGLEPLPTDDKGIDVNKVFAIFRNAVMEQKGWDVLNAAVLGNFSFSKFIMWNDIHSNLEALKENKIVKSLVDGILAWKEDPDAMDARQLDHEISPAELALPVASDSSQLEAVHAAASGKSFILHGPPGTGKSQTITNIIANALFHGKRVLFAAEKMAALSVVQDRLAKIGLAPFCLEVHSNKAKKSDVLAQLQASSEVTKVKSPADFAAEANKLFELRQQLNGYVEALHQPSTSGVSLYEAVTRYCLLTDKQTAETVKVPADKLEMATSAQLDAWRDGLAQLTIVANSCGHPASHPLRWLFFNELTPSLQSDLESLTKQGSDLLEKVHEAAEKVNLPVDSKAKFDALLNLATTIAHLPNMTPELLKQPDVKANSERVLEVVACGKRMQTVCDDLKKRYTDGFFALPAENLKNQWMVAEQKWFLAKWLDQRSIKKTVAAYSKMGTSANVVNDLDQLISYQNEKQNLDGQKPVLALFGAHPMASLADWSEMEAMEAGVAAIHKDLLVLCADLNQMVAFKNQLAADLADGYSSFLSYNGTVYKQLSDWATHIHQNAADLLKVGGLAEDAVADGSESFIQGRKEVLDTISANLSKLKDRYNYLLERQKLQSAGLDFFLCHIESKADVPADEWQTLFNRSFYRSLAEDIFAKNQSLTLFKGDIFEANIQRFRNLNAQYQELVKAELYAKLAANHPDFTIEAANTSEVGVLQKNIHNKGRGTSLRSLFDAIPNMLTRLTPCLLMSPMSIAQYLDVKKQPKFDLVIFDEASQMPTSEAVGAIARGENVIVVGDPKQMPPTSFFTTNNEDEDSADINDLESILDDCLALSIPSKYLRFHYRSKHESLIAFSNSQYYGSKLCTFPSPDNRISKVTFQKVDGHYDKGKSRQNKAEAQAVVDEVVRRLKDEDLRKRSIGIVTFSVVQQGLIDDLLTDIFAKDPQLDEWANQGDEPLFIKNLENVQGDERDVILFSVGYGPDANGNVSMNFGPLNQVGGERRLNVAVSRARYEMKVFSTLTADMIDLNRTSAEGVRGLKEFLAFAQNGTRTLTEGDMETVKGYESIATVIAEELKKKGYDCDTQVGCSSFRIDVAVVDPNDKGRYLLGILCDGDSYAKAQTARDREVCQPGILTGLGWNLMKVWTIDWWEDSQKVVDQIVANIEAAKKGELTKAVAKPAKPVEVKLEAVPTSANADMAGGVKKTIYRPFPLPETNKGVDALMSNSADMQIVNQMNSILFREAPVTFNYLEHRIAAAWGVTRITQKVETRLFSLLNKVDGKVRKNNRQLLLWRSAEDADVYSEFRTPSDRDSNDIPVEEYAAAMRYVLAQQVALPVDDLKRQTSAQLGFSRMGGNIDGLLSEALNLLKQQNKVVETDGKLKLS